MEKIYYLAQTGEPIPVGKSIEKIDKVNTAFGIGKMITTILVNETTIPMLLEQGIITDKQSDKQIKNIGFYINKLADKMGWKTEKVVNYLNTLFTINPASALSIILKIIAVDLDKKYPDYIGESSKIFTISMLNGKIIEVNKATIKNYKNFAAFRSIEDAKIACKICREELKMLFHE